MQWESFILGFYETWFLWSGRRRCVPLCWLNLRLRVLGEHSWLLTSDDLCEKRWVLRTFLKQISSDHHSTFHLIRGQLPQNKLRTDTSQLQIVGQNRMNGSVRGVSFLLQLHDGHFSITLNQLSHFFNHFFGSGCRRPPAALVILHRLLSILKTGETSHKLRISLVKFHCKLAAGPIASLK